MSDREKLLEEIFGSIFGYRDFGTCIQFSVFSENKPPVGEVFDLEGKTYKVDMRTDNTSEEEELDGDTRYSLISLEEITSDIGNFLEEANKIAIAAEEEENHRKRLEHYNAQTERRIKAHLKRCSEIDICKRKTEV